MPPDFSTMVTVKPYRSSQEANVSPAILAPETRIFFCSMELFSCSERWWRCCWTAYRVLLLGRRAQWGRWAVRIAPCSPCGARGRVPAVRALDRPEGRGEQGSGDDGFQMLLFALLRPGRWRLCRVRPLQPGGAWPRRLAR